MGERGRPEKEAISAILVALLKPRKGKYAGEVSHFTATYNIHRLLLSSNG